MKNCSIATVGGGKEDDDKKNSKSICMKSQATHQKIESELRKLLTFVQAKITDLFRSQEDVGLSGVVSN